MEPGSRALASAVVLLPRGAYGHEERLTRCEAHNATAGTFIPSYHHTIDAGKIAVLRCVTRLRHHDLIQREALLGAGTLAHLGGLLAHELGAHGNTLRS